MVQAMGSTEQYSLIHQQLECVAQGVLLLGCLAIRRVNFQGGMTREERQARETELMHHLWSVSHWVTHRRAPATWDPLKLVTFVQSVPMDFSMMPERACIVPPKHSPRAPPVSREAERASTSTYQQGGFRASRSSRAQAYHNTSQNSDVTAGESIENAIGIGGGSDNERSPSEQSPPKGEVRRRVVRENMVARRILPGKLRDSLQSSKQHGSLKGASMVVGHGRLSAPLKSSPNSSQTLPQRSASATCNRDPSIDPVAVDPLLVNRPRTSSGGDARLGMSSRRKNSPTRAPSMERIPDASTLPPLVESCSSGDQLSGEEGEDEFDRRASAFEAGQRGDSRLSAMEVERGLSAVSMVTTACTSRGS